MGEKEKLTWIQRVKTWLLSASPPVSADPLAGSAPSEEIGVSGTTNWSGRIHTEANSKLQWTNAYGTPGSSSWGEWEKLERTDHCVAGAVNLLAAPIRDAEVELELPADLAAALKPQYKPEQTPEEEEDEGGEEDEDQKPETDLAEPPEELPSANPLLEEAERMQVIASFVKDNLTEWIEPAWSSLLEQVVRYGLGYGFSLHEIVWGVRPDERVPGGTAFYVRKLAQRLPSSVDTDGWREENGELKTILQSGVKDGHWLTRIELPAEKCVLATWNRTGNNYQGFSAFRPGWYMGTIRAELLKIIAIGHQREALGVPVALVDKDISLLDDQRTALQELLENVVYHENAAFQLPPGVTIEWVFSPGANKGHVIETWRALGLAILELVQVQQQALGTGDTGSRAVGEVHDATKNSFVQGIRAWIEGVFNGVGSQPYTGLVKKIVDLNFGPQKRYPKFKLKLPESESDTKSLRQWQYGMALSAAKTSGVLNVTDRDEAHVREVFGLPEISSAERAALLAKAEAKEAAEKQARMESFQKQSLAEFLGE